MSAKCERSQNMMGTTELGVTTSKYSNPFPLQQFDDDFVGYPSQSQMMQMMQHSNMLTDINAIFLNMSPILNLGGNGNGSVGIGDGGIQGNLDVSFSDTIPASPSLGDDLYLDPYSPLESGWNNCLDLDLDSDDVFDVSKQTVSAAVSEVTGSYGDGPTLAALNSNSAILDDLDLEDLNPLPDESNISLIRGSNLNTPTHDCVDCLNLPVVGAVSTSPSLTSSSVLDTSVAVVPSSVPIDVVDMKREPIDEAVVGGGGGGGDAVPKSSALHELLVRSRSATISSSCPSQYESAGYFADGSRKIKREDYKRKTSEDCQREVPCLRSSSNGRIRRSFDSNACGSVSSMDSDEFGLLLKDEINAADSHDEGFDSELDDSDHYDFSDADSENSWDAECRDRSSSQKTRKKERYFWQYNLQAKGPKGTRLPLATETLDPHLLDEITDPVFSPSCQVKGIKHTGKARRGDGNDLNPNPKKLFQIGQELKKLNKVINDLTPVSELPFNVRPKSRKEKNKLASRACRLKKKAQHEANKLKLYGLDHEHRRLIYVLEEVKKSVAQRTNEKHDQASAKLSEHVDKLGKTYLKTKVAGLTAEFVNRVLDKVADGNPTGGIDLV